MSTEAKIPKIRVGVPYPNNGGIQEQAKISLMKLKECKELDVEILELQGASISVLRNQGVNRQRSQKIKQNNFGFDYYMCVDSDIEFKPEDVVTLVNSGHDIITGAYQFRVDSNFMVAGRYTGTKGVIVQGDDFLLWNEAGIQEIDWAGAGFLLIKAEVLEKLEYPWFREEVIKFENCGVPHATWVGEDVGFCLAAQKAGYKIYCDCDVKVNHLVGKPFERSYSVDEAYQEAMMTLQKMKNMVDMFYGGLKKFEQNVKNPDNNIIGE